MDRTPHDRADHAREIKYALSDPGELLSRLGLLGRGFKRQPRGFIVRCFVHDDKTPSCSVQERNGIVLWNCHGCGESGDALDMVAATQGLSVKRDFREVLMVAAEIAGLHSIVDELRTCVTNPDRPRAEVVVPEPEPEREYPPAQDVADVWGGAVSPADDDEACVWLTSRGLDAELVGALDLVRVIPKTARLPRWAVWGGANWIGSGHRVVFPMRDHFGVVRSLRGGRCFKVDGEPSRVPPFGCRMGGVVLADEMATALLAGNRPPSVVCIAEGETDFLAMATMRHRSPTGIIGVISGAWTPQFAMRFPEGSGIEVVIWTDRDRAGDRYAQEVAPWLVQRGCYVRRDVRSAAWAE